MDCLRAENQFGQRRCDKSGRLLRGSSYCARRLQPPRSCRAAAAIDVEFLDRLNSCSVTSNPPSPGQPATGLKFRLACYHRLAQRLAIRGDSFPHPDACRIGSRIGKTGLGASLTSVAAKCYKSTLCRQPAQGFFDVPGRGSGGAQAKINVQVKSFRCCQAGPCLESVGTPLAPSSHWLDLCVGTRYGPAPP